MGLDSYVQGWCVEVPALPFHQKQQAVTILSVLVTGLVTRVVLLTMTLWIGLLGRLH